MACLVSTGLYTRQAVLYGHVGFGAGLILEIKSTVITPRRYAETMDVMMSDMVINSGKKEKPEKFQISRGWVFSDCVFVYFPTVLFCVKRDYRCEHKQFGEIHGLLFCEFISGEVDIHVGCSYRIPGGIFIFHDARESREI
jgi:hypothetical protein